ncbi:group-specific protein [Alteribacter populi]|uniref:group-specific protein n=1 Tax=Alteribacter populi TaxID=2011011 RepID=UPI000BBAA315|nr:group-specific protein [Alteribacter populi]
MAECNLDHSLEDVKKKLESQSEFLPSNIFVQLKLFLEKDLSQATLNETFHLLKKYDLATDKEREERNVKMEALFSRG